MTTLLGIDIGTTKLCGVRMGDDGHVRALAQRPNDAGLAGSAPGRFEQDPDRLRDLCQGILRELAAPDVAGIGLTGQMHGMLCVDAANQPVAPLITWQDQRCLEPGADGRTTLDELLARVPDPAWAACGCRPASGYLGATLFWLKRHGRLPATTVRVALIHDWLTGRLTGQLPSTDLGDAGSSGICDIERGRWHADVLDALELPRALLPPLRPTAACVGGLTAEIARGIGLPAGTPVCNALGDNQASVLGSVADPAGTLVVNLGTGGQISWILPRFVRIAGMETRWLRGATPADLSGGHYLVVGASLCGGRAYAWLADAVGAWVGHFGTAQPRDQLYALLNTLAAAAPADAGGLRCTPTLAGTRADPAARGAISGIALENFTLGNLARAVLAGMVDELAAFHDRAGSNTHTQVVASGNAVRRNPLLREIISQRLARPVHVPVNTEEAACGAALAAGVGVGVWPDWAAARQVIRYA